MSATRAAFEAALAAALGAAHVDEAPNGPGGEACLRAAPADESELGAVLALAAAADLQVIPCGLGSKLGWCARPTSAALLVSTRRLCGIVSHEPADGTLAARAGTPMAELRAAALAGGHALTPDVPAAERATLGGVVAAGQSGFDRERYGPVRQHVLGARVLLADGTRARSGGQLVKNVTGFDLQRLYTGSHGTLCVVLEVALRLFPAPEHEAFLMAEAGDAPTLARLAAAVRASAARPLALVAGAMEPLDPRSGWTLFAGLGGKPEAVAREIELVRAAVGGGVLREGAEASAARAALRERDFAAEAHPWLRGSAPPSACASALAAVQAALTEQRLAARLWVQPNAALIDVQMQATDDAARLGAVVASWRAALARLGGRLHWRNAPLARRTHDTVWGPAPAGLELMRALRRRLDPAQRFAGGRLAGGL